MGDRTRQVWKWVVSHWGVFNPSTSWCGWCGRYEKECWLSGLMLKLKEDYQRAMRIFGEALLPAVAGIAEAMKPIAEALKDSRSVCESAFKEED